MHSNKDTQIKSEQDVVNLVNRVRDYDCAMSFDILKEYLNSYIINFGKKYRIPGCDVNEVLQECLIALKFKAIEDFNPNRGKFKSFAVLCIKRHLFSLIKGNNQHKRRVLNESLSLDEERSDDNGEKLSLASIVATKCLTSYEETSKSELFYIRLSRLMSNLSKLEQEVLKLYLEQNSYGEIVSQLKDVFPQKQVKRKAIDNALVRVRKKAQDLVLLLDEDDDVL